ncbi:MAG: hypothetical protein K2H47_12350 [Muribaculaceae bacterium]|nr:hypothetical protein [Muribaculaceae bacterium]
MKTNRFMCALGAAAILAAAASCNKNDSESTYTTSYPVYNLYTPLSGDRPAHVSPATYQLHYDLVAITVEVSASGLTWNNTSYNFTTSATRFTSGYASDGGEMIEFKDASATVDGMPLSLTGMLTNRKYYTTQVVPGIKGGALNYRELPVVAFSYNVGDLYSVRTFNTEAYMGGKTETTYEWEGETKTYTNDKMLYRTVIDTQTMTADMVIYNARFAEEMGRDLVAVVVKGLKVEWTPNGYRMSGNDIIPQYLEGGALQPIPPFTFNSISVSTVGDRMTDFVIDYEVAGQYKGHFTGSVILPLPGNDKQ